VEDVAGINEGLIVEDVAGINAGHSQCHRVARNSRNKGIQSE